jgi:hypothetical protein
MAGLDQSKNAVLTAVDEKVFRPLWRHKCDLLSLNLSRSIYNTACIHVDAQVVSEVYLEVSSNLANI